MRQHHLITGVMLLAAWLIGAPLRAQTPDVVEGEKLYLKECGVCHGNVSSSQSSQHSPPPASRGRMLVASLSVATLIDLGTLPHDPRWGTPHTASHATPMPATRLAIAPPFGPNLRGVYGRLAGTVPGFVYSRAFMNVLHGMEWNRSTLDVWLTNTQAWVPGVRMYYKQPDPEIRRKIILYLQANP